MEHGSSLLRSINVLIPVELLCCSGLCRVPSCPWKWAPLWVCVLQVVFSPRTQRVFLAGASPLCSSNVIKQNYPLLLCLPWFSEGLESPSFSTLISCSLVGPLLSSQKTTMEWQKCLAMWDFPAVLGTKSQELLYQQWQQAPSSGSNAEQWRAAFHLRPCHGCVERLGAGTERSAASALLPVLSTCICTAGFVLCRVCRSGWVLLPALLWRHGCLREFSRVAVLLDMEWCRVQPGAVPEQPLGTAWGAQGH